jgi:Cu-Zn family superoxide dismutase
MSKTAIFTSRALRAQFATVAGLALCMACKSEAAPPAKQDTAASERPTVGAAASRLLEDPGDRESAPVTQAIAVLTPTKGHQARGKITFTEGDDGVNLEAAVEGLPPGDHAYHIHLYGDCSSEDGKSAGTHLNFDGPSKHPPKNIQHITGNLGELKADSSGKASGRGRVNSAGLSRLRSIIGRSVIVHEKGNDESQPPIGAAGGRLACGVIGVKES